VITAVAREGTSAIKAVEEGEAQETQEEKKAEAKEAGGEEEPAGEKEGGWGGVGPMAVADRLLSWPCVVQ
jgi:hypothetical protein